MALARMLVQVLRKAKKLGQDDPRRIIHSFKVGSAITFVSLFYYFQPLYDGFGTSAMWAVLTVIVVFEFSVGATLGRGFNRGLATFLAGGLGFGAHRLANLSGEMVEPILLGVFVFLLSALVTFVRFFPRMKARYDYGLLIFILTFCLISVSGYREEELLDMAHKRVSTILIGGFTAVCVCIFVCPVWAGEDLHNLVANNIEKLANFMEAFGDEYLKVAKDGESIRASCLQGYYKSILNSKQSEESLANCARWEPGHGKFRFRHPWKQYLKIASLIRQCSYKVEALNNYLSYEIQSPPENFQGRIQEASVKMSVESGMALKELALTLRTMNPPSADFLHLAKTNDAAGSLRTLLKLGCCEEIDLLEVLPAATVASLLLEVATCIEKISESVHELAALARFKPVEVVKGPNPTQERSVQRSSKINTVPDHVIAIE